MTAAKPPRKPNGFIAAHDSGRVNPNTKVGNKSKLPTASKSPNKVTKGETAFARKYAKVAAVAKQRVDIKGGTTTRAQAKSIREARAQLQEMKKSITKQGYGKLDEKKNKRGGYNSHGIYKDLTGKPLPRNLRRPRKQSDDKAK